MCIDILLVCHSLQLQLEVAIQDAFLRFMGTILKGYEYVCVVAIVKRDSKLEGRMKGV